MRKQFSSLVDCSTLVKLSAEGSCLSKLFPCIERSITSLTVTSVYCSSTEVERSALEDLRNRARLGSTALPSVSFYTFINTHNR